METLDALLQFVTDNPIASSAVGAVVAAFVAFVKPIARALQRALIRRIDQAWPIGDLPHEKKVAITVDRVNAQTLIPRGTIEKTVRKHKSNPPPAQ